jgi:hypothetical protein
MRVTPSDNTTMSNGFCGENGQRQPPTHAPEAAPTVICLTDCAGFGIFFFILKDVKILNCSRGTILLHQQRPR